MEDTEEGPSGVFNEVADEGEEEDENDDTTGDFDWTSGVYDVELVWNVVDVVSDDVLSSDDDFALKF